MSDLLLMDDGDLEWIKNVSNKYRVADKWQLDNLLSAGRATRIINSLAAQTARANGLQAQLDALILEYCPDEMTDEQRAQWAASQVLEDKP